MTAQELIEILQDLDPETEIYVQHTAGDYWKTQLASPIRDGDFGRIENSEYHRQSRVVDEEPSDEGDEDDDRKEVFLITIDQRY